MALIKTEKLECDICGSCRDVKKHLFSIDYLKPIEGGELQCVAVSSTEKDLCPACLKRAMKFHARGLSKSDRVDISGIVEQVSKAEQ